MQAALKATQDAKLVFLDPDNSISITKDPLRKEGLKHVFIKDISKFIDAGKSAVI